MEEGSSRRIIFFNTLSKIDIRVLQEQLDYVSLVALALCELLEESGIPKEKILDKIHDIDMRDGKPDNKTPASKNICPSCHRRMSVRRTVCMYCGTPLKKENIL